MEDDLNLGITSQLEVEDHNKLMTNPETFQSNNQDLVLNKLGEG